MKIKRSFSLFSVTPFLIFHYRLGKGQDARFPETPRQVPKVIRSAPSSSDKKISEAPVTPFHIMGYRSRELVSYRNYKSLVQDSRDQEFTILYGSRSATKDKDKQISKRPKEKVNGKESNLWVSSISSTQKQFLGPSFHSLFVSLGLLFNIL